MVLSVLFVNHLAHLHSSRSDAFGNFIQISSLLVHDLQNFFPFALYSVQNCVYLLFRVVFFQLIDGTIEGFFIREAAAAGLHVALFVLLEYSTAELAGRFGGNSLLEQGFWKDLLEHEAFGIVNKGSHDVVGHESSASGNVLVFVILGNDSFDNPTDHAIRIQNGSSAQALGKGFWRCRKKTIARVKGQIPGFAVWVKDAIVLLVVITRFAGIIVLGRFTAKCFAVGLIGFGYYVTIKCYLVALVVYFVQISQPQNVYSQIFC
mmetsp:Transcript_3651/g.8700  ORF Transcript_3651/g.8700 Transcript_3651/m.8700 type:complete len:263 (+) Transcript_3651:4070-4858(+)